MRRRMKSLSSSSCSSSSSSSKSNPSGMYLQRNLSKNRYQILPYNQICKLMEVLNQKLLLASSIPRLPTIQLKLRQFLDQIRKNFKAMDIVIEDIRLNGGAASYVIGSADSFSYSDLDLIISLDGNCTSNLDELHKIRTAILNSILKSRQFTNYEMDAIDDTACINHINNTSNIFKITNHQHHNHNCSKNNNQSVSPLLFDKCFISPISSTTSNNNAATIISPAHIIPESYIHKQVRINDTSNGDVWSLISLGSNYSNSRIVELKLVYNMRRKYEFSVDSFQIKLDSLLTFLEERGPDQLTNHFYPTVVAESVWGSFQEAKYHLEKKLIMTEKPEEIRGGGLLKYCKLLVEDYRPHNDLDIVSLERYMCSRFFIDFPDLERQKHKLSSYLINHFPDDCSIRVKYLETLEMVVSNSTVCLMNHERYQTLSLINSLIYDVWNRAQTPLHIEVFNDPQQWALDRVFYGTICPNSVGNANQSINGNCNSTGNSTVILSSPNSLVHTPSDHSPTEPTVCPNFS